MFDRMDFDGGGDLSRQEIFVGLMNFGNEDISEKLVLAMINEADKDRDDAIGFLEFWCDLEYQTYS
jgi:Ca2+-binding EF-hand superfamily protein